MSPSAKLRVLSRGVRAEKVPDESRYGENRGKHLWFMFQRPCPRSPTRRPDTQRWVLRAAKWTACLLDVLLPVASSFLLVANCPFLVLPRELRTSLITRSFVLLCIPCWLSAPRARSICFFFCLLRLMNVLAPTATKMPLVFFSVVSVSLCYVNSAFASATASLDYVGLYSTFRIATHSVCFLVGLALTALHSLL